MIKSLDDLRSRTRETDRGCWIWKRATNKRYGVIWFRGKVWAAHRVSFSLQHPSVQMDGAVICHRCNVKTCINPSHLYNGTKRSNIKDAFDAGYRTVRGEENGRAKCDEKTIHLIRELYGRGLGVRQIGRMFNLAHSGISRIIRRKSWAHI